jgi:ABC-type glycerol-3-phosphate transport system substrate-binding protein
MKGRTNRLRQWRLGLTLALAGLAALVAACGGSSGAGNAGKVKGANISVTYMKSGTYDAAAKSVVPSFQRKTGAKVSVLAFPFAVLEQKNETDLATQTGNFDAMSVSSWDVALYRNLESIDLQHQPFAKDIIPSLLKNGPTPYFDGKPVGVPYGVDAYGIFYCTDLLKGVPQIKDWDQLVAYAKSLKSKLPSGVAPVSFAFGAPEQIPAIFQAAYDGPWLTANGKWQLDRTKAIHALQIIKDLTTLGPNNATALSIDEANSVFLRGQAAMLIGWPSFVRAALDDPKQSKVAGKWALGAFPGPGTVQLSNWNLAVSKYSKNRAAAMAWIRSYVTPEHAKAWMFKYGIGSPFKSTYEDPTLRREHKNDLPAQLKNLERSQPMPLTFQAFEAMYRTLGDMVAGKLSPAQTVDEIQKAWSGMTVPKPLVDTAKAQGFVA